MRCYLRTREEQYLDIVNHTLTKMACGGMYDQLGGGFHRYSVDAQWLVPHFEKMLYDNALLSRAYLDGCLLTQNDLYRRIAGETLDYVVREMTSPEGGFLFITGRGQRRQGRRVLPLDRRGSEIHPGRGRCRAVLPLFRHHSRRQFRREKYSSCPEIRRALSPGSIMLRRIVCRKSSNAAGACFSRPGSDGEAGPR